MTTRQSSIQLINSHTQINDILWTVLDILTDEHKAESSLDTLRYASQVTKSWRNLSLSSSSLWGRLLNLDILNERSPQWRSEVLRRSGDAPLYVQSHASEPSHELETLKDDNFLETLIVDNWHRIKYLSIKIPFHLLLKNSPITQVLRVPAPLLRSFSVSLHYRWDTPEEETTHLVDFGGKAPYLRCFDADFLRVPNQAFWLQNIRALCFKSHYTAHQVLQMLRSIPYIEQLEIVCAHGHKRDDAMSTSRVGSKVALRQLKIISVQAAPPNWTDYFLLLENIELCSSHSLQFDFRSHYTHPSFADFASLANILHDYIAISSSTEEECETVNRTSLRISFNESSIYILTHNLEINLEFGVSTYRKSSL